MRLWYKSVLKAIEKASEDVEMSITLVEMETLAEAVSIEISSLYNDSIDRLFDKVEETFDDWIV